MIDSPAVLSFGIDWATGFAVSLFCLAFEVVWRLVGNNCKRNNPRYELRFEDDLDFESQEEIRGRAPIQVLTVRTRPLSTRINVERQEGNLARALHSLLEQYRGEGGPLPSGEPVPTSANETPRSPSNGSPVSPNNRSPRTLHDLYIDDSIDREMATERQSRSSSNEPPNGTIPATGHFSAEDRE